MKNFLLLFSVVFLLHFPLNAQCDPPSSLVELNANNIRATLLNGGDFWWDGVGTPGYEISVSDTASNTIQRNVIFAGAIWLSALDEDNSLLVAGMTYRGQGHDFYNGPINSSLETVSAQECAIFDRHWEIKREDIQAHLDNVSEGLPLEIADIDDKILQWPAKGNAHFTQYNIEEDLAPFVDLNNNGIYDPENGDYPHIKGDQAIFWVVNDIGGPHDRSGGNALGVEVQFMAYGYNDTISNLNNITFYDVKVVKKTQGVLKDFYFGLFVDPDIGNFSDNYVGCNRATNTAFAYNTNAQDNILVSTSFLNKEMSSFVDINNALSGCKIDPSTPLEFRNFQQGLDGCGDTLFFGANGITGCGLTSNVTRYMFTGNPFICEEWSEINQSIGDCSCPNSLGQDKRYIQNAGPSDLNFLESYEITFSVTAQFIQSNNNIPNTDEELVPVIENLTNLYNDSLAFGNQYDFEYEPNSIANLDANAIKIYPNPVSDYLTIDFDEATIADLKMMDMNGRIISEISLNDSQTSHSINLSEISRGVYFLSIEIEGQILNYKLVK